MDESLKNKLQATLATQYQLSGELKELYSYLDEALLLSMSDGQQYVVKLMHPGADARHVQVQCELLTYLSSFEDIPSARVITSVNGDACTEFATHGDEFRLLWVLSYLPGELAASYQPRDARLMQHLGGSIAQLGNALAGFSHQDLERKSEWSYLSAAWVQPHLTLLKTTDEAIHSWASSVVADFLKFIKPLLEKLPSQPVHADLNEHNILLHNDGTVAGFIDYGDSHNAPRVCDLAIAATYFMMDTEEPLQLVAALINGYHAVAPLSKEEVELLFPLIKMRLVISLTQSHRNRTGGPQDDYITVSEQPALSLVEKLQNFPNAFLAEWALHAAGMSGLSDKHARLLKSLKSVSIAPVVPLDITDAKVIDLSPASGEPADPFSGLMIDPLKVDSSIPLYIGRWGEPRLVYQAPAFKTGNHPTDDARTIHAGVDLFAAAGTPVHAPVDGVVHAVKYHADPQDYGHVVVLRHDIEGDVFYTLYGHLGRDCLEHLKPGDEISKAQVFCHIGTPPENGGWPPHLHFQWILDDLQLATDIPGVCFAWSWMVWQSIFPNPAPLLLLPGQTTACPVQDEQELLDKRRQVLGKNLSVSYARPLNIVRGWQQYLFDQLGRCYLDVYNNVPHVGHSHPRVVDAVSRQWRVLNTNTRYLHNTILDYAEALSGMFADPLSVCFFVNSASEANELAMRLARSFTGSKEMIVMEAAYHGHTTSLIDISPYKAMGPGGAGCPEWVHPVPLVDLYRGPYQYGDKDAGEKYAQHVEDVISELLASNKKPGAYICESLPSVGGQLVYPDGYLAAVYKYVRAAGGLCIADEVQTGFGRTGDFMWGYEQQQVQPDIVVLGKPIANGQPLGAVITTPDIAASFDSGMEFFSTFGGNTVSCAAGLEVLHIVQDEKIQSHIKSTGDYLKTQLQDIKAEHPMVGDVRGMGFFLGVEMVSDKSAKQPATWAASHIKNRLRNLGILVGTDGPADNVLKIRPPAPFNKADADRFCETLKQILRDTQLQA